MTYTCPDGHTSTAGDYCDVCGAPIGAPIGAPAGGSLDLGGAAAPAGPGGPKDCPNCGTDNLPDALFCEVCGYDFTTGQLPRPLDPPGSTDPSGAGDPGGAVPAALPVDPAAPPTTPATPVEWVVEVWVDPDWYAAQEAADPCPSPGMPVVVPLREHSVLVGRTSSSRNIHPQVDLGSDTGVSRRHAQLSTDGQRWWVEDLQSANGTYVGESGGPVPNAPITPGQKVELADDDRVYVGAWTRLVVRAATGSERGA